MGGKVRAALASHKLHKQTIAEQCYDLLDIYGREINTAEWYKIMLADGTELGMSRENLGRFYPSGKGAVVRYRDRRFRDTDETLYGWSEGDVGYIKGISVLHNGSHRRMHLSLSNSTQPGLHWYESDDSTSGFYAAQIPRNRIVLYGRTRTGQKIGLRIDRDSVDIMGQSSSDWPLGLDCAFVPVGNSQWAANGRNF